MLKALFLYTTFLCCLIVWRIISELRAIKLENAINTLEGLDREESNMMCFQLYLMVGYIDVLSKRVQYAREKSK